jgi:ribonuclease BN (tRNA processing enzyme)
VKLTVLGCAGSFPGPDSACSAYLVEADGFTLMLDFGSGALAGLQRYGDMRRVDAILLSHLHCDHMLGACDYVVVRRYSPDGPYPQLPVYAPEGAAERMTAAYGNPDEGPLDDVYEFRTLTADTFQLGPFTVTPVRVNHPVETYGVRLEHEGRILAYSADSGVCDELDRLAAGADVFLCEASYLDSAVNPPDLHLTGREAGEVAAKAGAGRLLLTHLVSAWGNADETYQAAAGAFGGPVELVRPGRVYEI